VAAEHAPQLCSWTPQKFRSGDSVFESGSSLILLVAVYRNPTLNRLSADIILSVDSSYSNLFMS